MADTFPVTTRCPLCKAGILEASVRQLGYEGQVLDCDLWHCVACRETMLDARQVEQLRETIRRQGLAASDEQVEHVLERLKLQSG